MVGIDSTSPATTALFHQTGGSNSTAYLTVASSGTRSVTYGGTSQVGANILNRGVFDGGNQPATLICNGFLDLVWFVA